MPVTINEIETEVNAFDASALLTDEVLRVLVQRVAEELARSGREDKLRARDAQMSAQRRQVE